MKRLQRRQSRIEFKSACDSPLLESGNSPGLRALFNILCFTLLLSAIGLPVYASEADPAPRTLIACGHPFYPPVSWTQDGKLQGLAPAVTQELFRELGFEVALNADSNWKRCLLEVQQGKAHIVVAAYRIPSRESYLVYSDQYIVSDSVSLFINKDRPIHFQRLKDLAGKTVGLLLGDSFGDAFDRFVHLNSHIEYVSRGRQNFEKLAMGRIDVMPLGQLSGQLQTAKFGFQQQLQALPQTLTTEYYFLAVGRDSGLAHHLPTLNRRLREMHRDGTILRLTEQFSQQYLNAPGAQP